MADVSNVPTNDLTFNIAPIGTHRPVTVTDYIEGGRLPATLLRIDNVTAIVRYGSQTRLAGVTDEVDIRDVEVLV